MAAKRHRKYVEKIFRSKNVIEHEFSYKGRFGAKGEKRAEKTKPTKEQIRNIPEDKNIGNINDRWDSFCYTLLDFIEYIDLAR